MKLVKSMSPRYPAYMLILFNVLAFPMLSIRKAPYDINPLLIGAAFIALFIAGYFVIRRFKLGDEYIFLCVSMLVSIGEAILYRLDGELGIKQARWLGIGFFVYFLVYFVFGLIPKLDKILIVYPVLYFLIFLATMLFGTEVKGAKNWIFINQFSIQTSEILKLLFLFFLASYYSQRDKLAEAYPKGRITLAFIGVSYLLMGFLVLQREWGTPMVLFLVYFAIVYIFEERRIVILLNGAAAIAAALTGGLFVYHIKVRIEAWLNPWNDIAAKGYQIAQSLFAIGSGGFFGTGIGLGSPGYIPDVKTDFIFSAICEEMGIFGGAAVILLYLLISYRGFKIAIRCQELFYKALALGITLMFAFQSFVIIGGVIKLLLLTGITLPFISYGGSSMMVNFAALGVLQRISARYEESEEEGAGV